MYIKQLRLKNFRNYADEKAQFIDGINAISGLNAQGKTNMLESIFLLSGARSFRVRKNADLIRFSAPFLRVEAEVYSRGRAFTLLLDVQNGKKQASINGVKAKSGGELSDVFRCVLFSPEDIELIKGGSSFRRAFLDAALCQIVPRYGGALSLFQRALMQKSKVLKAGEDRSRLSTLLFEYNEQIAQSYAFILRCRARFIEALEKEGEPFLHKISGGAERLTLTYHCDSSVTDPSLPQEALKQAILAHLEERKSAEMMSESCLIGAHKDDMQVLINGELSRTYASQGQARSLALALKFAERELLKKDLDEYPVLLLDDVLSELDQNRRAFVLSHSQQGQTILTCCEGAEQTGALNIIEIASGRVV